MSDSRAHPAAADPDSPGRTVRRQRRQPTENANNATVQPEPPPPEGLQGQLLDQVLQKLRGGDFVGARSDLQTAIDRSDRESSTESELRPALTRIDWLIRWQGRAALRARKAQLERDLKEIRRQEASLE